MSNTYQLAGAAVLGVFIAVAVWLVAPFTARATCDMAENSDWLRGGRRDNEWYYLASLWSTRVIGIGVAGVAFWWLVT